MGRQTRDRTGGRGYRVIVVVRSDRLAKPGCVRGENAGRRLRYGHTLRGRSSIAAGDHDWHRGTGLALRQHVKRKLRINLPCAYIVQPRIDVVEGYRRNVAPRGG